MDSFNNLLTSLETIKSMEILILIVCIVLFLIEGYKFYKYKMKSDLMDFSLLGVIGLGSYIAFNDLFLSGLSVIFVLMVIGTYEIRESPVWVRLMGAFTITYGYLLFGTIFEKVLRILNAQHIIAVPAWILEPNLIAGFFWSTMLWVLLIFSFAFFGKLFILVSRFLSPQYVYLFLYSAVYVLIFGSNQIFGHTIPWQDRYFILFGVNLFIYLISGYLLSFLFQIKPLEDVRAEKIIREIEKKIGTKIKSIGIVQAPILNAFAYGPFFDQRFAFIVKDINNFTDEELLGIAAHEISHLKGKHTFWLLWIGFVDLLLRFALGIPPSQLDYVFASNANRPRIDLFTYYMVNLVFFAISLIFVRIMEANADKRAKKIGYGNELAEALFTLEGFYRGIAGELGLNAQLLTDTSRTEAEEKRFTGEAAIEMHNRLMNPSRYSLVMNLIVSHPPTPFRIAAMVTNEIGSIRLALLPIILLIPGLRGKNVKLLRTTEISVGQLLTDKYKKKFSNVESFTTNSYSIESLKYYLNRRVILISKIDHKEHFIGNINRIDVSDSIVDPFEIILETEKGEQPIKSKNYTIQIFEPDELYVGRNKQILTLKSVEMTEKGKYTYQYEKNSQLVKLKYLGITLKDLSSETFLLQTRGKYEPLDLKTINEETTPIVNEINGNALRNASFNFITFNPGKEVNFKGKEIKINLAPVVLFLYKKYEQENSSLIQYLIDNRIKLTLYTSNDPDISIPCIFTKIAYDEEKNVKKVSYRSVGETNDNSISLKQLDAIVLRNPFKLIQSTKEIGFFSKVLSFFMARGSKMSSL